MDTKQERLYTDLSSSGVNGIFDHESANKIFQLIAQINDNAEAA
jgi:hypothetical protein